MVSQCVYKWLVGSLEIDQEVSWCLKVLHIDPCESLTQDCVGIYCQWLSVETKHLL